MPIRAEMKDRYPKEWPLISLWMRVTAGWRCEWCNAEQGLPHPVTGSTVVLTVAHVDNDDPADVRPANLAAPLPALPSAPRCAAAPSYTTCCT